MYKSLKYRIIFDKNFHSYFKEVFFYYRQFLSYSSLEDKKDLIYSKIYSLKEFPEIYQNNF